MPLRWWIQKASLTAWRFSSSDQVSSQRSTENAHARYGRNFTGHRQGFHKSRSGTDKSLMTAHASAALCSSTDDPVAISELFIRAPDRDTGFGAVRGLGFIEHDVGQRLAQFDALDTLHMQRGINCRHTNVTTEAALFGDIGG